MPITGSVFSSGNDIIGHERVERARLEARLAGRWLAYLFLAAALLGVLNVVVPAYPGFNVPGLLTLSAVALVAGTALLLWRRRIVAPVLHAMLGAGNAMVAAAIHFTQGVPNAGSFFYLWVALYAFYFLPARAAAPHLALVGLSYATAIALRPPPFPPFAHWLTTVLMMATAGIFVGVLRRQRDDSLQRLERVAESDPLTGLGNRRAWGARAILETRRAARSGAPLAIVLIDLDGFKRFNDAHGHAAGDRLLVECAAGWQQALRNTDFIARLGGDEFGVLLPDCRAGVSAAICERLERALPPDAACSLGLAHWYDGETIEQTIARADRALYSAKRTGLLGYCA